MKILDRFDIQRFDSTIEDGWYPAREPTTWSWEESDDTGNLLYDYYYYYDNNFPSPSEKPTQN